MRRNGIALAAILVLLQFCCDSLWAKPTTAYQAEKVVRGWLKADAQPLGTALGQQVRNVVGFTDDAGEPIYYIVYLDPSGFVIVPADDLVQPIIGFVPDGRYNPSLDNPLGALVTNDLNGRIVAVRDTKGLEATGAMEKALESQDKWEQLESMAQGPVIMGFLSVSDVRVAPLVQSKWGQSTVGGLSCYNYYTPPFAPNTPSNYPCGCVATSLAQLMRFHQYPTAGIGLHSFAIKVDGAPETAWTRGGDGAGGPYDWTQMVLEPDSNATATQRQAIGALCYDAGISVNMHYTSSGSGTDALKTKDALTTTFGYSHAIKGYNDSGAALNGMVNPNLDYDHPVILGISGPSGGHAVIADGYGYHLSTLYHHLNMGWAGSNDAWYNLPNIDSSPPFTSVDKCVYNVFVSGSGEIISGRITDMSNQPISAATVTAQGSSGPFTASTNIKGIYAIAKVPSSTTFTVTVTKDGYTFEPPQIVTTATSGGSTPGNIWEIDFHGMIGAYPVLQLSPVEIEFAALEGSPDPEPQILSISNSGFGTLNWVINYDCNWLEVDPCEGSSTGDINEVTLSVDITGLAHGSYNCELTVSDPCAMNSPRIVNIFLHKYYDLNKIFIPGKGEYPTIQAAIDAAVNGDTVIVTPGTYTGNDNRDLDFRGKVITLRSIDPGDPDMVAATVIDCQATEYDRHRGFYFHNKESSSTIVDGITITNGYAPDDIGGGIRCHVANPTIRNCIIRDNTAGIISFGFDQNYGGGMYNYWSSPTLINCTFSGNSAQYGGGITNRYGGADPMLLNCTFIGNSARRGGGINNQEGADPTLTNCTFSANSSTAYGAGMSNWYNSSPTLTNCSFVGNSSTQMAAGMNNNFESCPTLVNCVFRSNSATYDGGAMSNGNEGRPNLTNCIIIGNSAGRYGGAMFCLSNCSATLTNCTFVGNSSSHGRALACNTYNEEASNVQIINCILWDGGNEIWNNDSSTITLTYSDVQGGWPGEGNINVDPCFVDADGPDDIVGTEDDNLRLLAGSPCIDAGDNAAVPVELAIDLDNHPRIADGDCNDTDIVDMGAYEFNYAYMGDFDYDCDVDFGDFAILGLAWLTEPPDAQWNPFCDISIPADNLIDWRDLKVLTDNWLAAQ